MSKLKPKKLFSHYILRLDLNSVLFITLQPIFALMSFVKMASFLHLNYKTLQYQISLTEGRVIHVL